VADLADAHLDVVFVIETERRVIADPRLADREVDAVSEQVAVIDDPKLAEVGDAPDLREEEVIRVVHDTLEIRFAEADSLAMRESKRHGRLAG
jgi:hypothetical protein